MQIISAIAIIFICNCYCKSVPLPLLLNPTNNFVYFQNFDSLKSIGEDISFPSENGPLAGWWVTSNRYSVTNGTAVEGGIYSYPKRYENGDKIDKSLGSLPSTSMKRTSWGVSFTISSTLSKSEIVGINVSYVGEAWSSTSQLESKIVFDYSVVLMEDYIKNWGDDDQTFDRWLAKESLSFPFNSTSTKSKFINHIIAIDDWKDDKVIQLRWSHEKISGKNDHLAINDFLIEAIPLDITFVNTNISNPSLIPIIDNDTNNNDNNDANANMSRSKWWKSLIYSFVGLFVLLIGIGIAFRIRKYQINRKNKYNERESLLAPTLSSTNNSNDEISQQQFENIELPVLSSSSSLLLPLRSSQTPLLYSLYDPVAKSLPSSLVIGTYDNKNDVANNENDNKNNYQYPTDSNNQECKDPRCPSCGKT